MSTDRPGDGKVAGSKAGRRLRLTAAVTLGIAVSTFPVDTWHLIGTIPGVVAAVALGGGFSQRPTRSVVPWALSAIAVVAYGAAPYADSFAPGIHVIALVAIAAAIVSGSVQRWWMSIDQEAEMHTTRHMAKPAWGALLISAAILSSVLLLRIGT